MIYCVIPAELADELYDQLADHHRVNPQVEVIVDRRCDDRDRRGAGGAASTPRPMATGAERRIVRDRRRARPCAFPPVGAAPVAADA